MLKFIQRDLIICINIMRKKGNSRKALNHRMDEKDKENLKSKEEIEEKEKANRKKTVELMEEITRGI